MDELFRQVTRFLDGLDAQQWLLVLIGVVVVGLVCLRGFGSRSDY